jgi:hypothetical protein
VSWNIDTPWGPFKVPGTDLTLRGSASPSINIPTWAQNPLTRGIDSSVPGTLNTFNLPDVNRPAAPPIGLQDPARTHHADRAKADYAAMQRSMINGSNGQLVAKEYVNSDISADNWPYGQLVVASLDRALVSGDMAEAQKALNGLDRYIRADGTMSPHANLNGARFTDDNAWIGLAFVQAFKMTGDQKYIDGARQIFDYLASRTEPDGKLYWSDSKDSYNTCSAAPAMQLGLALADLTHDSKYQQQADKWGTFLDTMRTGPNGLLGDNVKPDGTRDETPRTYNQGTMIGALVQQYEMTHDESKKVQAQQLASTTLDYFAQDDRLWREPPSFNAIMFRNLLQLDRIAPDPRIRATLERYLERADQHRNADGFYGGDGMGAFRANGATEAQGTPLIDQSAFVQMHALLAMTPQQLQAVT